MLESMLVKTRVRVCLVAVGAAALLAGCGVPPLQRSVVVQTNNQGIPVHASGHIAHDRYTVVRGDTLYSIAFRAGVGYRQLARWNGISAPYVIYPGEVLQLTAPSYASTPSSSPSQQVPVFQPVPSKMASAAATASATSSAAHSATTAPASAVSTVVAVAGHAPTVPATTASSASSQQPSIPAGATRTVAGVTWRWPAAGRVIDHFDPSDAMPGINIVGKAGEPVRAAASGVVVYSGNGLVGYGELVIIKHNDDYLSAYGHNSKRLVKEGEHVKAGQIIARMGSTGAPRDELEFQVRYKGKPVDPLHYLPKR